jgi:hypothetical protein
MAGGICAFLMSWDKPCDEIGDLGLSQEYYPPNLS